MQVLAETMTNTCVPALSNLAPDSGAYMNEVNTDICRVAREMLCVDEFNC